MDLERGKAMEIALGGEFGRPIPYKGRGIEMQPYFFASHVYQFAYAYPIFQQLGGTFVVPKVMRYLEFKRYVQRPARSEAGGTHAPLTLRPYKWVGRLPGVVISSSNSPIHQAGKRCTSVFLGHGTGDKKYGSTKELTSQQLLNAYDYHLVSGPKHRHKLRDVGLELPEDKLIEVGNVRFDRYLNGQIDMDAQYARLGIEDRTRKNILYAPTWEYGNGTFGVYFERFARELSRKYYLIVRPHYHDRGKIPASRAWVAAQGLKHVYFSNPAEVVRDDMMSDFAVSDLMISDTSAIIYEYLVTGNPIIIAVNDYDELHGMPGELDARQHATPFDGSRDITELVGTELHEQRHRETYRKLLEDCFYFNDGKSVQRVGEFLQGLSEAP